MKTTTLYTMVMMAMMFMMNGNANAQRRGDGAYGQPGRHNSEMAYGGGHHNQGHRPPGGGYAHSGPGFGYGGGRPCVMPGHRPNRFEMGGRWFDNRWHGCIRYEHGRWGYLRGNNWYWYNTYYEPDYYFAHPVGHFHHVHMGPVGKAAVGAIVVGAIIAGLCR